MPNATPADRRFLASIRGAPGLAKMGDPTGWSASYAGRIARGLKDQLAYGGRGTAAAPFDLPVARRGVRGAAREAPGRAAPARQAAREAAAPPPTWRDPKARFVVTPEGAVDVTVSDRAALLAALRGAVERGVPAVTLAVKVGGEYVTIDGGTGGLDPRYALGVLEGNRSLRGALRALLQGRYVRQREPAEEGQEESAFGRRRRRRRRPRSVRSIASRIDVAAGVRVQLAAPDLMGRRVA